MQQTFNRIIEPRFTDIDANKHLRHTAYFDYATIIHSEWLKECGFPLEQFLERSVGPVIFHEEIHYYREIPFGQNVHLHLEIAGLTQDYRKWHFRVFFCLGSGAVAAKHDARGAWMDMSSRKIVPPPFDLSAAFASLKHSDDYAEIVSTARSQGQ